MTLSSKKYFNSPFTSSINKAFVLKNETEVEAKDVEEKKPGKYDNIEYKKQNPFIFGGNSSNPKFHKWYNFVKFAVVTLTFIFGLIALWYATQWTAIENIQDKTKTGALLNLSFDLNTYFGFASIEGFDSIVNPASEFAKQIKEASALGLSEWKSSIISSGMIDALIAISFVGLVMIIPTLVFKNGTAFSLASLTILFISFAIIFAFFTIGVVDQCKVTSVLGGSEAKTLYLELQDIAKRISILDKNSSADEIAKLTEQGNKLVAEINKVSKLELKNVLDLILGSAA